MRSSIYFAITWLFASFLSISGCKPSESDVSGQVFIVTKGGQSYKLGLVEVKVLPEETFKPYIQEKMDKAKGQLERLRPVTQNLKDDYEEASLKRDSAFNQYMKHILSDSYKRRYDVANLQVDKTMHSYLTSLKEYSRFAEAPFFLGEIPRTVQTVKTDADGKFSLKLSPSKYAVVASASRQVGESTEEYYWIIWVTVKSGEKNNVTLSNDNLFETNCQECIIKDKDLIKQVNLSNLHS